MEPIDNSFAKFKAIRTAIEEYSDTIVTEADTRLKVLDRFFIEVLGWGQADVLTEDPVQSGFIDYNFKISDRSRLIVEAKRDGASFKCGDRKPERAFNLNGAVFGDPVVKQGIGQAVRYCGSKNAELACVTNGREWVVFRGNRLGDGKDTLEGVAFVFSSLQHIQDNFKFFYSLLSREAVSRYEFQAYFQDAEGLPIRTTTFSKTLSRVGRPKRIESTEIANDITRVMNSFFGRLNDDNDPDLLNACFVVTRDSSAADASLARISQEIVGTIRKLSSDNATELSGLIERAMRGRRNEFVIIVGTKGSGKSTFITRFFRHVLADDLARDCVVMRVNLGSMPGDSSELVSSLDKYLLTETEASLFGKKYPSYDDLRGIFFDEYVRLSSGPWKTQYESNKDDFQIQFGNLIEEMRKSEPHRYIQYLIRHVVNSRKKLPVLVFDNADHFGIEFQEKVYQYARSIYETSLCLVIVPITDRTSWQLTKHGALQSFEHEALFLPTPPTSEIIRKRIQFMQSRIASEGMKADSRYFVERGIYLSIENLTGFCESLQRVFLETARISEWIGELANHDVRRALELCRNLVTSPHIRVADLMSAYVARSAIDLPPHRAARALIKDKYETYPAGQHDFVQNVFSLPEDALTSPMLGVRLLQLLKDAPKDEDFNAFLSVDEMIEYCQAMGISQRPVQLWLDYLLKTGLVLNYDPTVVGILNASSLELAPAGARHLFWATSSTEYLNAMSDVTEIHDESAFEEMRGAITAPATVGEKVRLKIAAFVGYLLDQDRSYCRIPDHDSYAGQANISCSLEKYTYLERVSNI